MPRPERAKLPRSILHSLVLLAVVAAFCAFTQWGRTYVDFAVKTWRTVKLVQKMPMQRRWFLRYDETYPVLLYIRDKTPPGSVILMPPRQFIVDAFHGEIPLLASDGSAYSFIYPRIPVHYGDDSPSKDKATQLLVWNHWGLDQIAPGTPHTEENRIALYPIEREVRPR
jgi:hypothetical protein